YFDNPVDLDAQVAGLRRLIDIAACAPFAERLAHPYLPERPDPSDDDLRGLVRAKTQTLYHPVGTCAMGSGDHAVVDAELRVRGVDGLRVVDASVMPVVPRGNTNAPTIMIGERAADLLKESA
ncbi:MAG: GMC family oxidoreductase, partial [Actinomycetia bacterium]|nr:GMC family oxidoreductase [Actinomycetes bacterium]